jgi:hypothetical protein
MRNIDLASAYRGIYEDKEQIDEVAPIVAGLAKAAGKAAVTSAASTAGSNVANKLTKPKNEEYEPLTEGEKDACYHKVKSRYDVWPSAYASGALVKCRAKGASNWGNSSKKSSKKEEFEYETEENYTSAYMEGYKSLPADKMKNQQKGKSRDGDGPAQARKMEVVRKATQGSEGMVKDAVKGQEMSNKKRGLEKRFAKPAYNKTKNKAYKLEADRRQDLNKRYGPKKEELEAVFATLIGEGIAHDEESAINIMTHMSDDWYDTIVEDILDENLDKFRKAQKERRENRKNPDEEKVSVKPEPKKPVYDAPAQKTKVLKPRKMRKGEGLGVGARKRQGVGKVSGRNIEPHGNVQNQ